MPSSKKIMPSHIVHVRGASPTKMHLDTARG
jgi:hypothetical protein